MLTDAWRHLVKAWLERVHHLATPPEPMEVPDWMTRGDREISAVASPRGGGSEATTSRLSIGAREFPKLFGTPVSIQTVPEPNARFVYLDPDLETTVRDEGEDKTTALHRLLCRRRREEPPGQEHPCDEFDEVRNGTLPRLVEPGVGRACLAPELYLGSAAEIHDFTVLGVGLTQFSEGGYVDIGRKIDGKASLFRAWHRKAIAERLEAHGCRTGRVVGIIEVGGDLIEMPNGKHSPAALLVRGFRCGYRVKQLDPLICCLHSIQHTPLVSAYLADRALEIAFARGTRLGRGLEADEALARAIEMQGPAQESLRALLHQPIDDTDDWATIVARARIEAIEGYAPLLVDVARRRLALELGQAEEDLNDANYLTWFAASCGAQLRVWRRERFLHDYHQPGVSRWQPGHYYTLGENNVTLLAEFPDLDTGIFVDDDEEQLNALLQLPAEDIQVLRDNFIPMHQRDVEAAKAVVRVLAAILFREDPGMATSAAATFHRGYADA